MELKTILVTQARMGSTRLPGKILKEINGKPLLKIHLDRLRSCEKISEIIVATTTNPKDTIIYDLALEWGYNASRGSESDVLDRYYQAVKEKEPDWVVRVTSDCPLLDPKLVDDIIEYVQNKNVDYGSNVLIENFPDGQDVELFKFSALKKAWENAELLSEREHVSPFIRNNCNKKGMALFTAVNYDSINDYSRIRMTVDEPSDFELIKILVEKLGDDQSWKTYTEFIIKENLDNINNNIVRNEGYLKSLLKDGKK